MATSCILKQIAYYFDLKPDEFSHGYQINKGFSGGYIFKPWLYLWLKFISNITEAIENKFYKDYYIVKTDIRSFYDNIPHDNLKRLLLGDGDSPIKNKVLAMREDTSERYKKCLDAAACNIGLKITVSTTLKSNTSVKHLKFKKFDEYIKLYTKENEFF